MSAQTLMRDGVWNWYAGPALLIADDKLFCGAYTTRNRAAVVMADLATGDVRSTMLTPEHSYTQDDHGNPSLAILQGGKLLANWGSHNGERYTVLSESPYNVDFGARRVVSTGETDAYTQMYQVGDSSRTIYDFFRRGFGAQRFRTSTDQGATWSATTIWMANTGQRPYLQYAYDAANRRIHFAVNDGNPAETLSACSVHHGYIQIAVDGTRTYHASNGTLVGTDANLPFAPSSFTLVHNGATGPPANPSWMYSTRLYDGLPVLVYSVFPGENTDVHEYRRAVFDGTSWTTEKVADGGTTAAADGLYTLVGAIYSGGITLDPLDKDIAYLGREFATAQHRMERWQKIGGTWTKTHDLSGDTGSVNARPYAASYKGTTYVVWWEGTYTSFTNWDTRVCIWPPLPRRTTKIVTPQVDQLYLPSGARVYTPLGEGAGTPANVVSGGPVVSLVGSPTWSSEAQGPRLGNFSTSNYLTFDALAAEFIADNYPLWFAILFRNTATTAAVYPIALGASGSVNPILGLVVNHPATGSVSLLSRDLAGTSATVSIGSTACNDGNLHMLMGVESAPNLRHVYFDTLSAVNGTSITLPSFDRTALGCLRRATTASAFAGQVVAMAAGHSRVPMPRDVLEDWINGRYSGLGPAKVATPSAMGGGARRTAVHQAFG